MQDVTNISCIVGRVDSIRLDSVFNILSIQRRSLSGASLGEAATGADLGGSSKYSNENFED